MYQPQAGQLINDGKPIYLATTGHKLFELSQWWEYKNHFGQLLVVPDGFIYDLASIPPWLWWLQFGTWNIAAIPHDWAYVFGYLLCVDNGKLVQIELTKKEADQIFADVNFTVGTPKWRVRLRLMYWAVRIFGRGIWSKPKQKWNEYGKSLVQLQQEFEARTNTIA